MPDENLGKVDITYTCRIPNCGIDDIWEMGEQKFLLKLKQEGKIASVQMPSLCRTHRKARAEKRKAEAN